MEAATEKQCVCLCDTRGWRLSSDWDTGPLVKSLRQVEKRSPAEAFTGKTNTCTSAAGSASVSAEWADQPGPPSNVTYMAACTGKTILLPFV